MDNLGMNVDRIQEKHEFYKDTLNYLRKLELYEAYCEKEYNNSEDKDSLLVNLNNMKFSLINGLVYNIQNLNLGNNNV